MTRKDLINSLSAAISTGGSEPSMHCEVCHKGMKEGVTLHRVNAKGVKGIWRCPRCLTHDQEANIDTTVRDIVGIIEKDNRDKTFENL